jgi:hypothetical protein
MQSVKFGLSVNYVRYLHSISCLQNTPIIIVCKQTSALHIINPRNYHILRRHVCFINLFYKNI